MKFGKYYSGSQDFNNYYTGINYNFSLYFNTHICAPSYFPDTKATVS